MKERKAYIILVVISMFFSAGVYVVNYRQEVNDEHKFCDLITASLTKSGPVTKPVDPGKDPKAEALYDGYVLVRNLGRKLGCS